MRPVHIFRKGIRFTCLGELCNGHCCTGDGVVYLFAEDVLKLSCYLNISIEDFLKQYADVEKSFAWKRFSLVRYPKLIFKETDRCFFLDESGKCKVYVARPLQCIFGPILPPTLLWWISYWFTCPAVRASPMPGAHFYSCEDVDKLLITYKTAEKKWKLAMLANDNDYVKFMKKVLEGETDG
jgi:Fe-S-cluster containining protein